MGVQERRARQKANIREEILDAARTLFVKEGYEHVSMRKIAEKAEYAPGTIYLYFRDKAEILEHLSDETFARLSARMQAINADASDPLEALRRGLRTYIQFGIDNPDHYVVTFVLAKEVAQQPPKCGQQCFGNLRNAVRRAIETGQTNCDDVEEVAQALWAGAHGAVTLLISKCPFPFIEPTTLVDRVVTILIEGIRKREDNPV
jgi:AcrR family transcriptional regulator